MILGSKEGLNSGANSKTSKYKTPMTSHLGKRFPSFREAKGELRQVFLTIIVNALDAMEDQGTLTIETGAVGNMVFA